MQNSFPFEKVWFGVELEDIRPHQDFSTYEGSPFDLLPTIDTEYLDINFSYLSNKVIENLEKNPANEYLDITFKSAKNDDIFKPSSKWQEKIKAIQATLPLALPEGLVKFMSAPKAHGLIPSCTACYFDLPEKATTFQYLGEDGYLFHFYRDQQDCLFWYFYVRKAGESCILASPMPFGVYKEGEIYTEEEIKRNVLYTASSFEEFIYRTWVENILWFDTNEGEANDEFGNNVSHHCELYRQRYGTNI